MDQSHTKKSYILTMHAKERYRERVANGNSNTSKSNTSALKWVTKALNNGHVVSENKDGTTTYRYQKFLIVMSGKTVITISYHNDRDVKPLKEDIKQIILRRLKKEIKPLVKQRKELLIKASELEIEVLKSTSRNKQIRLRDNQTEITKEGSSIRSQVKAIIDLGSQYGLSKQDLILDSDLI